MKNWALTIRVQIIKASIKPYIQSLTPLLMMSLIATVCITLMTLEYYSNLINLHCKDILKLLLKIEVWTNENLKK